MVDFKKLNIQQNQFIAYKESKSKGKIQENVIFFHGLKSDMGGSKAEYLLNQAKTHDFSMILFDNLGHGRSSLSFEETNIHHWVDVSKVVLEKFSTPKKPAILIGSSMGGWLALIMALRYPNLVKALILIAPAPDFTEKLMWERFSEDQKQQLIQQGYISYGSGNYRYNITNDLITSGRQYLIMNQETININKPIHILQGMQDQDVPWGYATLLAQKITSPQITLKLIKDGEHSLSRDSDLSQLLDSLKFMLY